MRYGPVSHREAEKAVIALGFSLKPQKSTSHTQWVKECPGEVPAKRKVTLDKHNSPYCKQLIRSIIRQSGVSKKEFYKAAGKSR